MGLKEYFKKQKEKKAKRRAQMEDVRDIQMKALQEERLIQAKVLGEQQAKIERKEKVKRLQQQIRTRSGGGVMSAVSRRINIAAENLGYAQGRSVLGVGPAQPRIQKQRIKKPKYVTIKGRKYMRVPSKKKRKRRKTSPSYSPQPYNPFATSL